MCDSGHMEGSACTTYNTGGLDSTWCGFSGDPCANCNDCGDNLGYCYLDIGETECLSLSNHQWCGSNPSPTPSPCDSCNYCYHDGYCDSAATTETDCASFFGQWCFSGSSDACLDSTGVSCGACLATSDLTCRWGNMCADSVLCTAGGFGTWCGGDACSSCNYCYRDGFCDSTLTDSASCTSHSSTTGGLGKWCGATPYPTTVLPGGASCIDETFSQCGASLTSAFVQFRTLNIVCVIVSEP